MGKVLKYAGWAFLGIVILVLGTVGILFATGAFSDEIIYLDSITLDEETLKTGIDASDTTLSVINDTLVVTDNFAIDTTFEPATATAKTLNIKVLKGGEVVTVPKAIVAGEPLEIKVNKVCMVYTPTTNYKLIDNVLYYEDDTPVDSDVTYELFPEVQVARINGELYKYYEYNVGGEVKIQATDSEGGTTYTNFEFFVDSAITKLNYDFSSVENFENNTIVLNESNMYFTLDTTPVHAINPSTGEVYGDIFSMKNVETVSSDEDIIKITKAETQVALGASARDTYRYFKYTFNSLRAGTSTITSKTLPTYQMYLDYLAADEIFNTDTNLGYSAVTDFANKYINYLITAGNIIEIDNGDGTFTVSTEGYEWYKTMLNSSGKFIINYPTDYTKLMNFLFITTSQEIIVENIEIQSFRISTSALDLDLFDTVTYNGQPLNRQNMISLFGMNLQSTSANISQELVNTRLDDLLMYSVKEYQAFDSVETIEGEGLFTVRKMINGLYTEVPYYRPFESTDGTIKYMTYVPNDAILSVINPNSDNNYTWTIRANKEQEREDDGTAVVMILYDEVSGQYFDAMTKIKIKVNQINVFSLNTGLITDMSLSAVNDHGKPNRIYVDLRYQNVGKTNSLIREFTEDASYTNIKLFVTAATAKLDGVLKIRVKTKDGTETGEPMVYMMPIGNSDVEVYEIDYTTSDGLICIEALNTSIKYELDGNNNPSSAPILNTIMMYVGVVRTDVQGRPVDSSGNLVDDKFDKSSGDPWVSGSDTTWEYMNQYDFIKVASESLSFNIYSYLQGVQFYTADETATGSFLNRTTEDGILKEPVKMIVGQSFDMYVTNLPLDENGGYTGKTSELNNYNTAFFDFYFNNLTGQNKSAMFETNNPAAVVQETIDMIKGMVKITVECKDSTTSVDLYIAVNEEGNNFLENCTVNMHLSFATIAKVEDTQNNDVSAFYTVGASTNQIIKNNETLIIKGVLQGTDLTWQVFDEAGNANLGQFIFGGTEDQKSLDYNINLNLDPAYEYKRDAIVEDIKTSAEYNWTSSRPDCVEITEKADANGYDPLINICKGTPEGIAVAVSCQVFMYSEAKGSSDTKFNGTTFTFRFVLNIIQSDIVVNGYSIYEQDGSNYWQINDSSTTAQKILGGSSFDILKQNTAKDTVGGNDITRNPITATIDNIDIRSSLTFTIETYTSADNPNSHHPIYFLDKDGNMTYTLSGLTMQLGDFSLVVYAKDILVPTKAGVKISTYYSGYADYVYNIVVLPNLAEEVSLPAGSSYIETTRGVGDTYYTFDDTGKTLDDYYAIKKNGTIELPLKYTIESNEAYGTIQGGNQFVPNRVAPLSSTHYQEVRVLIQYDIDLPNGNKETYTYDTISIHVLPYYTQVDYTTREFAIKSGADTNIFTAKAYNSDTDLGESNPEDFSGEQLFSLTPRYSSDIDDLNDIFRIKLIEDSEGQLQYILGDDGYLELLANNMFLTDGDLLTNASLVTDELVKFELYFREYNKDELIGGGSDSLLYFAVKNTVRYETAHDFDHQYEKEKLFDIAYNAGSFNVDYKDTTITVFDNEPSALSGGTNLVALKGGNGESVFSKIVKSIALQEYNQGAYTTLYNYSVNDGYTVRRGTNTSLIVETSENMISKVVVSYDDSVNVATTYRLVFTTSNDRQYEFFYKLLPNVTISPFYPVEIASGYENVEYGTTVDLETNYIRKYNRVELAYNSVVLGARLESSDTDHIVLSVPSAPLLSSGLVDKLDTGTLGGMTLEQLKILIGSMPYVNVRINDATSIFEYSIVEGSKYIDSGAMTGSRATFVIPEGGTTGNAIIQVKAFNGAVYNYVFRVQNKLAKYVVSVTSPSESEVFANNDFELGDFINSCRIDSVSDYTKLRIIIVDFNGTTLRMNNGGSYSHVDRYDLINPDGVFKFDDVSETKVVVFRMYTTTSIDGDAVVELHMTVKPNAIITQQLSSVPAGVEIQLENTDRSPFIITHGDIDRTLVYSGDLTYTLVDEHGDPYTYDIVSKNGNKITYVDVSSPVLVYIKVEVALNSVVYTEILSISFVPNVRIVFDYESSAVSGNYKNLVAASITKVEGSLMNNTALDMWDHETNNSSQPITISDYYGNSLAADNLSATKPTISFELTESGGIIDNVHPTQGTIYYFPSNKANVQAKVTVVITWANGAVYRRTYNIHFQPNVATNNGVQVEYTNQTGNTVDNTKSFVSIYGGSRVEILTFNTNNDTIIDARVKTNTVFMQAYKKDGVEVINSVAVNVFDSMNDKTISYIRFNSDDNNDLYKIVYESGKYYIDFEAVKQQTQISIPYYLDLVNINGGGVFTTEQNQDYYKSLTKGEIVVNLFPVIANVSTIYNSDNPRSLIIREGDTNIIDMYNILNVTLIENATFTSPSADAVVINKDRLAKLFSMTVEDSFAYKDGQNIVFNLNDKVEKKIQLQFTIEGFADTVTVYIDYGSKATLGTIDPVKTFTFKGENYYIIENLIYNYKMEQKGDINGEVITIEGSHTTEQEGVGGEMETVEIYSVVTISELTYGDAEILYIYSAEAGQIDLSTLVKYEVQNRKVVINGITYYLDELGVGEYQLIEKNLTKYTGEFEVSDYSILIEEVQTITKTGNDKGTVVFDGVTYYVNKSGTSEYGLYSENTTDEDKKVTTIGDSTTEFIATPKVDFINSVVYFDKEYPLVDESVSLSKNGLTYILGSVGENDKYIQNGNILELIPFYSTDLATDKKPFTFDVNSNNNLSTEISFYILPVETVWSITFNGTGLTAGYVDVTEPASGAIGTVNIEAIYQTLGGTKEAEEESYKYRVDGSASVVSIDENSNVLKVNYEKFSEDIVVTINVQAYFNGQLVTNSWDIKISPLREFSVNEIVDTIDPKTAHEYLIEDGADGFVTRGSYGADSLVFELSNASDSEYASVNGNVVNVESSLYLLTTKEIKFNVTFTTKINDVTCIFNKTVSLILNANTKMLGLQQTYTAGSANTIVDSGDTMKTTMNSANAFKLVDITDETNEYSELDITISRFSPITDSNYDIATGSIEARIEGGLINIYFTPDTNGHYPASINASFVINVTYGTGPSAKVVYTSDTIRAIVNNPMGV